MKLKASLETFKKAIFAANRNRILFSVLFFCSLSILVHAQSIPAYVPSNGLVGWWPFNGNANDESGNGNNGTVNGAIPVADRFSNINSAYQFSSSSNTFIQANIGLYDTMTFSSWFKTGSPNTFYGMIYSYGDASVSGSTYSCQIPGPHPIWINANQVGKCHPYAYDPNSLSEIFSANTYVDNLWHNVVVIYIPSDQIYMYVDGQLTGTSTCSIYNVAPGIVTFGRDLNNNCGGTSNQGKFDGDLDDIGIWNRALTQQEITNLYNAVNCANNLSLTPANNPLVTGSTANFTATTSDPNPVYQWQTNPANVGWMNVQNNSTYNASAGNLTVSNVQLANHQQAFRVISTSGNCVDTSNLALLTITDTCINTINDTNFITVTDTLLINAVLTGINPPNNQNTIKVFPNPANTHITIDYGNFASMNGYQLKITNSLSQQVFLTSINQQSNYIDLSTWSGNGIYFVHLIDPQGNTVDIRKIVLQ